MRIADCPPGERASAFMVLASPPASQDRAPMSRSPMIAHTIPALHRALWVSRIIGRRPNREESRPTKSAGSPLQEANTSAVHFRPPPDNRTSSEPVHVSQKAITPRKIPPLPAWYFVSQLKGPTSPGAAPYESQGRIIRGRTMSDAAAVYAACTINDKVNDIRPQRSQSGRPRPYPPQPLDNRKRSLPKRQRPCSK